MAIRRKVRQSQTIMPFGVGGILDLRGESFVATDITTWGRHGRPIVSRRLAAKLRVQQFRTAPEAPDGKRQFMPNVPGPVYARFPKWLFCPSCRFMIRWKARDEDADRSPSCVRCVQQLVPMRFVQICADGHMADVDWVGWAHSRARTRDQEQCGRGTLRFVVREYTGGLGALVISCLTCKAERTLSGITSTDAMEKLGLRCSGRQPWQRLEDAVECKEKPRVVQRGASNVYFPEVHSAIDIPNFADVAPHDDAAAKRVHDHVMWPDLCSAPTGPAAGVIRSLLAVQCDVAEEFVDELIRRHEQESSGNILLPPEVTDLSQDEWAAFTAADPNAVVSARESRKDPLVLREVGLGVHDDDPEHLRLLDERITKVVAVDRLREVRALEGFWRLREDREEGFVSVHPEGNPSWLPAIEAFGEGVFFTLEEQRLRAWEKDPVVWHRVVGDLEPDLNNALQKRRLREQTGPKLLPRYVLLHTLAHMLVRQLAFDCGYSAAALRERVYARGFSDDAERVPQAGVLIYTAAADSEGTLGGLVRQGEPPRLAEGIIRLLEAASWCSNDPLCRERTGFANLNRAACHACTFLPETSCETGNTLLDRELVVGTGIVPGFFAPVVTAAIDNSAREVSAG